MGVANSESGEEWSSEESDSSEEEESCDRSRDSQLPLLVLPLYSLLSPQQQAKVQYLHRCYYYENQYTMKTSVLSTE